MTLHQKARRARKSKAFFARLAERAALAGDKTEATRLLTASLLKRGRQTLYEVERDIAADNTRRGVHALPLALAA